MKHEKGAEPIETNNEIEEDHDMKQPFLQKWSVWMSVIVLFLTSMLGASSPAFARTTIDVVPRDKQWTITVNEPIDAFTKDDVYVKDATGKRADVHSFVTNDGYALIVRPPEGGYEADTTYTLVVSERVTSQHRNELDRTVERTFRTNDTFERNVFEPRKQSANAVTYGERVTELPLDTVQLLQTADYESDSFTFQGTSDALASLTTGDIVIFPPTDEYPFGWSKEIVKRTSTGNKTTWKTKEPALEDVIASIDISQLLELTADDLAVNRDVHTVIASEATDDERTFQMANEEDGTIGTMTFAEEDGEPVIRFANVELSNERDIHIEHEDTVHLLVDGTVTFHQPTVGIDFQGIPIVSTLEHLSFESGATVELETSVGVKTENEWKKRFNTGVAFPIRAAGVAGADIQFFIQFGLEGEATLTYEIGADLAYAAGVTKVDDDYEWFNDSNVTPTPSDWKFKGSVEGTLAVGPEVEAKVAQFTLASFDVAAGYRMNVSGHLSPTEACYTMKDDLFIEAHSAIGRGKLTIEADYPLLSQPLSVSSTCDFDQLIAQPIRLPVGGTANIELFGVDRHSNIEPLDLVQWNVSYTVDQPRIVAVNRLGKVRALSKGINGQTTTIRATYENESGKTVETLIPVELVNEWHNAWMQDVIRSTQSSIRDILSSAEVVNGAYGPFESLEGSLRHVVSERYMPTLKQYYENNMHPTVGLYLFMYEEAFPLYFNVAKRDPGRFVVETVLPPSDRNGGTRNVYSFITEQGEWKLDNFVETPLEPSGIVLQASPNGAKQYITNRLIADGAFDEKKDKLTFQKVGEDQRNGRLMTYYTFEHTHAYGSNKFKYYVQDGYYTNFH